jgi:hypothetical protein
MIHRSKDFDLGLDTTRMKDADTERQSQTVDALLDRFFPGDEARRTSVQLLADEVGMGKTFVALGVAYSILAAMRTGDTHEDLGGCAQKILVLVPSETLKRKWQQEVSEFVKRCIPERAQDASKVHQWFRPRRIEHIDDLVLAMRSTGHRVLVMATGDFGRKLSNQDLKKRFALAALCRRWGNGLTYEARERMLRGAPEGWPTRADGLEIFEDGEWTQLVCSTLKEGVDALDWVEKQEPGLVESCREQCRTLGTLHERDRDQKFAKLESRLLDVYRWIAVSKMNSAFPLVIVDEAHHWRTGPSAGKHGYGYFRDWVAPLTRRALLLTATPFQLRPAELLELLRVGLDLAPAPTKQASQVCAERLAERLATLKTVIGNAERSSRRFAQAWGRFPGRATREMAGTWASERLEATRQKLRQLAHEPGAVSHDAFEPVIEAGTQGAHPDVRELLREGLGLFTHNEDLSQELGEFIIRHRRSTVHRLVRAGGELASTEAEMLARQDRHQLHAALGLDVKGPGELPHYLLMRCVAEMNRAKGQAHHRTSLGDNLTGCYSTLLESAEGRLVKKELASSPTGKKYFDLLVDCVDEAQDPKHPKVRAVVDRVVDAWHRGEKVLIFCFRTNTAERLKAILGERITSALLERRQQCLGGEAQLESLINRLRGSDADLAMLTLDRVLWSFWWAHPDARVEVSPAALRMEDDDLDALACVFLQYDVNPTEEHVDRIFVLRATEHVLARRLRRSLRQGSAWRPLLDRMADPAWVERAYALTQDELGDDSTHTGDAEDDERAELHEVGALKAYGAPRPVAGPEAAKLAETLRERRTHARERSVLDAYVRIPSLWLGVDPSATDAKEVESELITKLHTFLWSLTRQEEEGGFDFRTRALVLQGLRSAVVREALLVRLLPSREEREVSTWGKLLVERFFQRDALLGQRESMLERIVVFLEDLQGASGDIANKASARAVKLDAMRMRNAKPVELVTGKSGQDRREKVFQGFNSPLLPEVLICTQVGGEGIDLHRYCRLVIHYDLPWNPAIVEQRTGRIDRIGSKTFRERERDDRVLLEISVPYLAGTYDERIFEELRVRAQTFEVLTGGSVSADAPATGKTDGKTAREDRGLPIDLLIENPEGDDEKVESVSYVSGLAVLPDEMVEALRVRWDVASP